MSKVIGEECKHIFLGHLSKENNYGELAYETVKVELLLHNIDLNKADFTLQVASRTAPTVLFSVRITMIDYNLYRGQYIREKG